MKFYCSDRLIKFERVGLGLPRDNTVRLLEHSAMWREIFNCESTLITKQLSIASLKLHHGGSTAIAGIVAKPILDIVGEVENLQELDDKKNKLIQIGYHYKGEYGIKGRRYSTLYDEHETIGFCHLHIFQSGSIELEDHLIFKNYLNKNQVAAKRYEAVKKSLKVPRNQYSEAKSEIIAELLKEARKYFKLYE